MKVNERDYKIGDKYSMLHDSVNSRYYVFRNDNTELPILIYPPCSRVTAIKKAKQIVAELLKNASKQ